MNEDPTVTRLREIAWRRPLTNAEKIELRAWLGAHPEAQAEWAGELELSRVVAKLPNAPAPSNFTARVLAAVEREVQAQELGNARSRAWWWRVFLPRTAAAAAILVIAFSIYRMNEAKREKDLVSTLSKISREERVPPTQALEDYDYVADLSAGVSAGVGADEELLTLMR